MTNRFCSSEFIRTLYLGNWLDIAYPYLCSTASPLRTGSVYSIRHRYMIERRSPK
jgi:hypothetical protein